MNPFKPALGRRLPLAWVAALVCALAVSARGWEPVAPPIAPAPAARWPLHLGDDIGRRLALDDSLPLPERQAEFFAAHARAVLAVFPVRIGPQVDTACAVHLARVLPRAAICHACGVTRPVALVASRPDADAKALWESARDFRDYVRRNPTGADYALFVEYVLAAERPDIVAIHLVLCDARGDWVIVDRQDFRDADLQALRPGSKDEADSLVVKRLQAYLTNASAGASHQAQQPADRRPIATATPPSFTP